MGRYIIDAKSALGVYALDLRKPIDVEIHSDDEEEIKRFNMAMEEFKIGWKCYLMFSKEANSLRHKGEK